jgi:hypothetical protein
VSQLAWVYDRVDPCDQVLPKGESQHGGDYPAAQGNDAGLTVDVSGGQGRPRVAEEPHDLLGDRFAADVWLVDNGQRPTDVGSSDD